MLEIELLNKAALSWAPPVHLYSADDTAAHDMDLVEEHDTGAEKSDAKNEENHAAITYCRRGDCRCNHITLSLDWIENIIIDDVLPEATLLFPQNAPVTQCVQCVAAVTKTARSKPTHPCAYCASSQ